MMWTRRLTATLAVLAFGCTRLDDDGTRGAHTGARTFQAVRAATHPTIDGRLADPCWQNAEPLTGFLLNGP